MQSTVHTVWQSLAWPSTVCQSLQKTRDGLTATGFAAGRTDQGLPFVFRYTLHMTHDWEVHDATIMSLLDGRTLALRHAAGKWYDADTGTSLRDVAGARFLDLSFTPFTNTQPIRQLNFAADKPQRIKVVYFDENKFSIRKVEQEYRKLDDHTYIYQDIEQPDFSAKITVDETGLVVDYEHLFKRV